MIFLNFYHTMIIKKLTLTNNLKSSKYGRLVSEWRRLMATWGPLPPRPPTKIVHPTYKIWSSDLWNMCQCIQTIHKVLIQHTNCAFNQNVCIRFRLSKVVHPTYKSMCIQPTLICSVQPENRDPYGIALTLIHCNLQKIGNYDIPNLFKNLC